MGFNYIFWGILFAFFDFRVQGLDILPDVIGFILIFNGVGQLTHISERFTLAGKFAIPLIVLSIFDIYQGPQPVSGIEIHQSILGIVVGVVVSVLTIILFYSICKGIEERALMLGLPDLARQAMGRWTFLLVFECSVIIVPYIAMMNVSFASILFVIVFLLAITVIVMLMTLMKSAKDQFPEDISY